jgi:hypothetical protein
MRHDGPMQTPIIGQHSRLQGRHRALRVSRNQKTPSVFAPVAPCIVLHATSVLRAPPCYLIKSPVHSPGSRSSTICEVTLQYSSTSRRLWPEAPPAPTPHAARPVRRAPSVSLNPQPCPKCRHDAKPQRIRNASQRHKLLQQRQRWRSTKWHETRARNQMPLPQTASQSIIPAGKPWTSGKAPGRAQR